MPPLFERTHGGQNVGMKDCIKPSRKIARVKQHRHFAKALAALRSGEIDQLRKLLQKHSDLIRARTNLKLPYNYFTGATLLHHVAGNPSWNTRLPKNIVQIARLLLEHGADVDSTTLGPNRSTTMGLVLTSKQASDANISGPLIDLLLEFGAKLDLKDSKKLIPDWVSEIFSTCRWRTTHRALRRN